MHSGYYHLRNIGRIRQYFSHDAAKNSCTCSCNIKTLLLQLFTALTQETLTAAPVFKFNHVYSFSERNIHDRTICLLALILFSIYYYYFVLFNSMYILIYLIYHFTILIPYLSQDKRLGKCPNEYMIVL